MKSHGIALSVRRVSSSVLRAAGLAVVASSALCTPALAAPDELMQCKTLGVKMDRIDPNRATFKLLCEPGSGIFTIPFGVNSPLTNGFGAAFYVRDLVSNLEAARSLPSANWKGMGNPPGIDGYRYSEHGNSLGCRSVRLDTEKLKLKCAIPVPLGILPAEGELGFILHFHTAGAPGTELDLCAQVGGEELRNDEVALKRRDAPAPAECIEPVAP
jgi:hypothetical protein